MKNHFAMVVQRYKKLCQKHTKRPFPVDPYEQLELAIKAVFDSWMGDRALVYREKYGITRNIADGTAVNIVSMVCWKHGKR